MAPFRADLEAELSALAAADRLRALPAITGASRVAISASDQPRLSFASNDYLGLANHPALAEAAARSAAREGFGASASRLVSGDLPAHRDLEQHLAAYLRRESALLFPTGYQTNVGVLTALARPGDAIISDALNHASIVDGCRLSRAQVAIYPHADAAAAERLLAAAAGARRRILVTESLFSMDGDTAPLTQLAAAARSHDAVLVVDEAHALGVAGPGGRGLCAAAGVVPDILVGTLGKAFAAAGGFAASDTLVRRYLLNKARTFIFTTALPPPVAAAATAALDIIAGPEGERLRDVLQAHAAWLAPRLTQLDPGTPPRTGPIVPFILGPDVRALQVSASLARNGIFVPAIRPPTVPSGSARLRITLSAAHTPSDLEHLVQALGEATRT